MLRAREQDRSELRRARKAWRRQQGSLDPARRVFLDESGAKTHMTRLRGRAPRGERVHARAPGGHWQTTTMLSAIRWDGTTACMTIAGATDTAVCQTYVREVLCPTLRPGDLVVRDNLSPHKNAQTLQLIAQVGAEVRFLPAYSPDLNPIEKRWRKVKQFLRSAAARDWEKLQTAIATALATVTAKDALNWFASCGYSFS